MIDTRFRTLLAGGWSEAFLRSPLGSPEGLRSHYLAGHVQKHQCRHCGLLFAIPHQAPTPVLNARGMDMRFMYSGTVLEQGYCSPKCSREDNTPPDLFGDAP